MGDGGGTGAIRAIIAFASRGSDRQKQPLGMARKSLRSSITTSDAAGRGDIPGVHGGSRRVVPRQLSEPGTPRLVGAASAVEPVQMEEDGHTTKRSRHMASGAFGNTHTEPPPIKGQKKYFFSRPARRRKKQKNLRMSSAKTVRRCFLVGTLGRGRSAKTRVFSTSAQALRGGPPLRTGKKVRVAGLGWEPIVPTGAFLRMKEGRGKKCGGIYGEHTKRVI